MINAAAIDDIGPRCVVVTVAAHVGTNTAIPTAGVPLLLTTPDSPIFHDGNALLTVASRTAPAASCIYAGVVTSSQPRQYLAAENIVIICVAVEGAVTAVVETSGDKPPVTGGGVTEQATGGVAGTIIAPTGMITPQLWRCILQLEPPGRLRAGEHDGGRAGAGLFFSSRQDATGPQG